MKIAIILFGLLIFLMAPGVANAQGPTSTPAPTAVEQTYSRESILDAINAPVYHLTEIPVTAVVPRFPIEKTGSVFKSMVTFFNEQQGLHDIMGLLTIGLVAAVIAGIIKIVKRARQEVSNYNSRPDGIR